MVILKSKNNKNYAYPNPIAHYKLNDNAANTTVVDSMGNFNGVLNGGDNTGDKTVTGKIGDALTFNGIDDYIQANFGNPTSLTYSCWFKITISEQDFNNPSGDSVQLMWTQDDNPTIQIKSSGVVRATIKDGTEVSKGVLSTNTITDADWNHVAITFDGSNLKLYLNGALEDTEPVTGRGALIDVSRFMRDDAGRFVKGDLDDVRVYNTALTQEQISLIYNGGAGYEASEINYIATGINLKEINSNVTLTSKDSSLNLK